MAYNTKSIVKDVNQKPVPQIYNPTSDVFEVLQGKNGANRVILYTEGGSAIDLASLIATIVTAINTTGTTQLRAGTNSIGKVEVTANVLPTGSATATKQDTIISAIGTTNTKSTELKTSIDNMYNKDTTKTSYGLSTDVKPTTGNAKGDAYFEINTSKVFMWNGAAWVEI